MYAGQRAEILKKLAEIDYSMHQLVRRIFEYGGRNLSGAFRILGSWRWTQFKLAVSNRMSSVRPDSVLISSTDKTDFTTVEGIRRRGLGSNRRNVNWA